MTDFNTHFSGFVLFGTLLGLAIAIVLWSKESDHKAANRFLSLCLLFSSVTYAIYGLLYPNEALSLKYQTLFFVPLATEILILPHCYFYVRCLYQVSHAGLKNGFIWHYVPFLCASLLLLAIFSAPEEAELAVIQAWFSGSYVEDVHFSITAIGLILLGQLIAYLGLILLAHRRYQAFIKDIFSEIESVKLKWVRGIIMIWGGYLFIHLCLFIIPMVVHTAAVDSFVYFFISINVLFYLYIAIRALQHPYLFDSGSWNTVKVFTEKVSPGQKYDHSPLSEERAREMQGRLLEHLTAEKPFLDSELTINQLAQQLELTSSKQLSQLLNQVMNESFYQLINRYRVEEAIRLLKDKPKSSMIDIAFEAGFKSVSTFYNHFKTVTGKTPKELQNRSLDIA